MSTITCPAAEIARSTAATYDVPSGNSRSSEVCEYEYLPRGAIAETRWSQPTHHPPSEAPATTRPGRNNGPPPTRRLRLLTQRSPAIAGQESAPKQLAAKTRRAISRRRSMQDLPQPARAEPFRRTDLPSRRSTGSHVHGRHDAPLGRACSSRAFPRLAARQTPVGAT